MGLRVESIEDGLWRGSMDALIVQRDEGRACLGDFEGTEGLRVLEKTQMDLDGVKLQ